MKSFFTHFLAQQHLLPSEATVLLAVSGGRDSVCLLHLAQACGLRFAVAHCNFNLRPAECLRDRDFVVALAASASVPFHEASFDTRALAAAAGQSVEECARHLRYAFFARLCREHGYACVAVAHHRDDAIETFFLNLFRGAGLSGLHGMEPSVLTSAWSTPGEPPLRVVRPLLGVSRAQIDAYVAEHGLRYVEDSTNAELDARRNRLRLQLMPLLRQLYPSVDATMAANMQRLADASLLLDGYVASLRSALLRPLPSRVPAPALSMQAVGLEALRAALAPYEGSQSAQCTLLFELLRPFGFRPTQAAEVHAALAAPRSGAQWRSATHEAVMDRASLILAPLVEPVDPPLVATEVGALPAAEAGLGRTVVYVDADALGQGYSLRPWRPADAFCPFGMGGRSRLVSDVLKDLKLSLPEKRHVRLLVAADGRVVWLVGLRADHRFRVSPSTRRVLRLEVR